MRTRSCQATDATPIFDLITASARCDHTRALKEHIFQQDFFSGPDGAPANRAAVAVVEDGSPVGFVRWEGRDDVLSFEGWVHPQRRRQGVGTALLHAVEGYARRSGYRKLATQAYADIPGVEPLFKLQGYDPVRAFNMLSMRLCDQCFGAPVPPGVQLKTFEGPELEKLVAADNAIFADHWGAHPVSLAAWQRRMIDARPHEPQLWIIAWAGSHFDQIVGECLCHANHAGNPQDGWISVVGVRRDWRGCGLGRAVMMKGLQALQRAGFETASLNVDSENSVAINLYRSLGMEVVRTRLHFHKVLK